MPLDGLTLKVLIDELNPLLKNGRVMKIYQPNEFTITFQFRLQGKTKTLLLSADPLHPRIHTVSEQLQNPLNPPSFCMLLRKYLEPSRLLTIEQQGLDRIIHFRFECPDERGQSRELILVFEIMGRQSNAYLINEEEIILDALKRYPNKDIIPGAKYLAPSDQGKITPIGLKPIEIQDEIRLLPPPTLIWKWIINTFQGFSKVAAQEVVRRAGFAQDVTRQQLMPEDRIKLQVALDSLILELEQGGNPAWYKEIKDFAAYSVSYPEKERFINTDDLIRTILGDRSTQRQLHQFASNLRRQLSRHLKRVIKKEKIQEKTLQNARKADSYRKQGELLTASFHLIPTGANKVEVPDYTQEEQPLVTIKLDPHLSPSNNVQKIFKHYNKAKASQKYTAQQLKKTKAERKYLENVSSQVDLADDQTILEEIKQELINVGYIKETKKKNSRKNSNKSLGPERYTSADGLSILVGRNNKQNDELTFRLSSPNHLWFHARNIPGSHVLILAEEPIPEDTIKEAALLAGYFSKSRNSPKVDVDYTLRRNVRKPRGAKPGFVHYDNAKTIVVDPTKFEPRFLQE